MLETTLAVLYGAPDEGVCLAFNGGAIDVGRENGAESAICAAITAHEHPVGAFSPDSAYFTDCACLLIITARITDAMLDFISDFRMRASAYLSILFIRGMKSCRLSGLTRSASTY